MKRSLAERKRIRRSFESITPVEPMPNLMEVLKSSYNNFLQFERSSEERKDNGLQGVLKSVFPINDSAGNCTLEFISYHCEEPKYDVPECRQRGTSYSSPLKVKLRMIVYEVNEDTGAKSVKDIREQDVYFGDIPLMTDNATFVINGIERVIISQMHRSPGVFFDCIKSQSNGSDSQFSARIIPYNGSWLEFEFDTKDILNVRIDRRSKLPVTTLLYALSLTDDKFYENMEGTTSEEILSYYYNVQTYKRSKKGWITNIEHKILQDRRLIRDLVNAKTKEVLLKAGRKVPKRLVDKWLKSGIKEIFEEDNALIGRYVAEPVTNSQTGEVILNTGEEILEEHFDYFANESIVTGTLNEANIKELKLLDIDWVNVGGYIRDTLMADKNNNKEGALIDIYRMLRPGDPPSIESAQKQYYDTFFNPDLYDLSAVGRMKMNMRLGFGKDDDSMRQLCARDIFETVRILSRLRDGYGEVDDIDHLGNRRVRPVGELMENQLRLGLFRLERTVKERMNGLDLNNVMPNDVINAKPVSAAIWEFFSSSQLSQFMDQTNPLSEVTHKRRFSALGPGGMTRERAGFEVRDVHTTHYGRICPIETPEGPNIGLINSLANFGRINKYGFIETPYRKVVNSLVTDEVEYLSAIEEWNYNIAQAHVELDTDNKFVNELVPCRRSGDLITVHREDIHYIDVSPKQIVSVATALIPFLENDDANRALMGANMQRQAVPLLRAEAPLVGTGMEAIVARDSGVTVVAKNKGQVQQVDGDRLVIKTENDKGEASGVDIYKLMKFQRSNQNTCINQKPLVKVGDLVEKGDILADGPSTEMGELALGKNVLVAFMPWNGYNYEDSILISERIVQDDVFTSIHIEEFEVMARDTKLGEEEITRDIPNVGEDALRHLDETGIVYVGAEVHPGDILVGKVTPKGESPITPEEKLLRAIFGEKVAAYRDTSLRLPSGTAGTVVDVRIFNRRGVDKDERSLSVEQAEIESLRKDREDERKIIAGSFRERAANVLNGEILSNTVAKLKTGSELTADIIASLRTSAIKEISIKNEEKQKLFEQLLAEFNESIQKLDKHFENKVNRLQRGDELQTGVLKQVKVFVAAKRKLQPGDKMAGRHGNKGVVSTIMPIQDMPYLEDGTTVDIVLNPLGVPSRMNVGQILETHLGWAVSGMGKLIEQALRTAEKSNEVEPLRDKLIDLYEREDIVEELKDFSPQELKELSRNLSFGMPIATPVFDGAREHDISRLLTKVGYHASGQSTLYDGRTGEAFSRPITVGYIYMLKLHHLVDDKMHARSIGPYSLVTQQPLGGKAQFGGQRFGEMEVWALEAYGAAYILQEMLTIKSDDVTGRTKVYEAIVRGEQKFETGIPESFNVLIKELQALGLSVELLES